METPPSQQTPPPGAPPSPPYVQSAPPPPPPLPPIAQTPKRRFPWVLALLLLGALGFMLLVASVMFVGSDDGGGGLFGGERVAVVSVTGMIASGSGGGGFLGGRMSGSRDIVKQLNQARRDDHARAVVLYINSPGGSAAASQEIYEAVENVRKAGKPVVASMADVAASGGYYVASAADTIFAQPATLTGSIGVTMPMANMVGLYEKIGYKPYTIKAGKYKDIGSSSRPMTDEEREMLQAMVDDIHDQFIEDVARGRKWSKAKAKSLADGSICTGRQALASGLVDELGSFTKAVQAAAKAGGIKGEPRLLSYGHKSFFEQLIATSAGAFGTAVASVFAERLEPGVAGDLLRHPGL